MALISTPTQCQKSCFQFPAKLGVSRCVNPSSLVPPHNFTERSVDWCLFPPPPLQALYYFDTLFYQALGKGDNKPEAPCLNLYFAVNCFLNSGPLTEITVPGMSSETGLV